MTTALIILTFLIVVESLLNAVDLWIRHSRREAR